MPILERDGRLQFDFGGVQVTTQSFVHALLAEPLRKFGPENLTGRIYFVRASAQVKQVLAIVVESIISEAV